MTQHNLQVPEEIAKVATEAAKRAWSDNSPYDPGESRIEKTALAALQAILPKVRERLLSDEALVVAGDESSQQHHFRPYDPVTRTLIEAAFDAAFPPEDSPG